MIKKIEKFKNDAIYIAKMNKLNAEIKAAGKDPFDNVIKLKNYMEAKEKLEKDLQDKQFQFHDGQAEKADIKRWQKTYDRKLQGFQSIYGTNEKLLKRQLIGTQPRARKDRAADERKYRASKGKRNVERMKPTDKAMMGVYLSIKAKENQVIA